MSNNTDSKQDGRDFDHFSIVPFKAICGADVPNQSTSQIPEHVKCTTCRHYWNEWNSTRVAQQVVSRASVAAPEGDALGRIQKALEDACDDLLWSTRPSASDYVILEGSSNRILAFLDEANARQLVKRHNVALATFLTKGNVYAAASSPSPAEPPQTEICPVCKNEAPSELDVVIQQRAECFLSGVH